MGDSTEEYSKMVDNGKLYMGLSDPGRERVYMYLSQANRHGLIAGASGTGKTVTMKVMTESFSDAGVPVFLCDVKGDVSGLIEPGEDNAGMQKRIDKFGIRDTFQFKSYPVTFWDIYGKGGHPIRTTVSDMGPEILSRIMGLTEVQEGVLNIIFRIADEHGLEIIDLKDLRAVLQYIGENRAEYSMKYGNMAAQSISAITRALIPLEDQGGNEFFGEPALDITDWIRTDASGHGMINLLHAVETIKYPKLYAAFLLWMMAELFEVLPEVGDPEKPTIVFFFDEAHLLFNGAPRGLVQKIEQTVKLIRSKGVGIYFVTQSPSDIPDSVLAQCSNRVQHALRAYTPAEQKAVRTAAQTFRANPAFKTEDVIMQLGTGEALVSFLDEKGIPQIVEKTSILCPQSLMAPASEANKARVIAQSPFAYKYNKAVDNESAYEILEKKAVERAEQEELERQRAEIEAERAKLEAEKEKAAKEAEKKAQKEAEKKAKEEEKAKAAAQKKKDRVKAKIETLVVSTAGQLLRKGLFGILSRK